MEKKESSPEERTESQPLRASSAPPSSRSSTKTHDERPQNDPEEFKLLVRIPNSRTSDSSDLCLKYKNNVRTGRKSLPNTDDKSKKEITPCKGRKSLPNQDDKKSSDLESLSLASLTISKTPRKKKNLRRIRIPRRSLPVAESADKPKVFFHAEDAETFSSFSRNSKEDSCNETPLDFFNTSASSRLNDTACGCLKSSDNVNNSAPYSCKSVRKSCPCIVKPSKWRSSNKTRRKCSTNHGSDATPSNGARLVLDQSQQC